MIVYATQDQQVIYGDHHGTHKNGRVPLGEPLTVITEVEAWYQIKEPAHHSDVVDEYPDWYVQKSLVSIVNPNPAPVPAPVPVPTPVAGDAELGAALRLLIKAIKEG